MPVRDSFDVAVALDGVRTKGPARVHLLTLDAKQLRDMVLGLGDWEQRLEAAGEGAKEDAPAWVPARFRLAELPPARSGPGDDWDPWAWRKRSEVEALTCLVLDVDDGGSLDRLVELGGEHWHWGYTTWSHTPGHPKARVVFPLAEPVPAEQWPEVWQCAARWARAYGVQADEACKDLARVYFLAAVPLDRYFDRQTWEGGHLDDAGLPRLLHADWLRAHYPPKPAPAAPRRAGRVNPANVADARTRLFTAFMKTVAANLSAKAEGGRNVAAYDAGLALGLRAADDGIQEQEIDAWAVELVQAAVRTGLPEREAGAAVYRGLATGRSK